MAKNILFVMNSTENKKVFRNEKGLLGEVSFSLPQCQGKVRKSSTRRITGFYSMLRVQTLRDAKSRLQKLAERRQDAESFHPFAVSVVCAISYQDDRYLSVIRDRSEKRTNEPEVVFRRSDIWDIKSGFPVLWEDLFIQKPPKAAKILSLIHEMCKSQGDEGIEGTIHKLRLHFDREQYYLTPDSIVFYFQPGTLAPPDRGCLLFPISFGTLGIRLASCPNATRPRLRRLQFLPD